MGFHDGPDDGQTQPRPRARLPGLWLSALKAVEEAGESPRRDPRALVAEAEYTLISLNARAPRVKPPGGVGEPVVGQVEDHPAELLGIAQSDCLAGARGFDQDPLGGRPHRLLIDSLGNQGIDVDRLPHSRLNRL